MSKHDPPHIKSYIEKYAPNLRDRFCDNPYCEHPGDQCQLAPSDFKTWRKERGTHVAKVMTLCDPCLWAFTAGRTVQQEMTTTAQRNPQRRG